ncbi:cleft lip and palate transmembrane protein 1-domain-containing protein [Lipomyces oligophaga]|uniref:cleft lip and palate transmembrane protein 1-domain-containing protein n=1 Tax=Lipomyces oligophaga TaxID=45792 RepID=UPI0034CF4233
MPPRALPGRGQVQEAQEPSRMGWIKSMVLMMCFQYFVGQVMQKVSSRFKEGDTSAAGEEVATTTGLEVTTTTAVAAVATEEPIMRPYVPIDIQPLWPQGTEYDFKFYITDNPYFDDFDKVEPFIEEDGLVFGDFKTKISKQGKIPTTRDMRNNGSVYGHMYASLPSAEFRPQSPLYDTDKAFSVHFRITHYLPRRQESKARHLLGSEKSETADSSLVTEPTEQIIVSKWPPNITIGIVDSGNLTYVKQPPTIRQWIMLEATDRRDETEQKGWYYPIIFYSQFWQLASEMVELNSTVMELPISLDLSPMKFWKFSIFTTLDAGFKEQAAKKGGNGGEIDELKRILFDTNIYLLATTFGVSILHSLFEFLAFKNDISHWRKKKDNVGISVRTIIANVVMQAIIFLYLFDNNENTSWMILFSQGSSILVEAWKITKAVDIKIGRIAYTDYKDNPLRAMIPYKITVTSKHELSEIEKKTEEYDKIAFKYMYILAVPLLLAYAVWSVIYQTHKSWYSFVIRTLVGSVYAYGFLMLVPSIYINYRLKSVAHMPRKAMVYKFLNTFIDDLFAFVVKMPLLHRIATLRDDVIFFIYLYQTWIYRVDPTRANEFGQVNGEMKKEDAEEDKAEKIEKPLLEQEQDLGTASSAEPVQATASKRTVTLSEE